MVSSRSDTSFSAFGTGIRLGGLDRGFAGWNSWFLRRLNWPN